VRPSHEVHHDPLKRGAFTLFGVDIVVDPSLEPMGNELEIRFDGGWAMIDHEGSPASGITAPLSRNPATGLYDCAMFPESPFHEEWYTAR
jgi:hypothetical protein